VNFFGEVGGVQTQQLLGVGTTSESFLTMTPDFSAPIDKLRIVVASAGDIGLLLDNFDFTPVTATPEPASLTLLGLGVAGIAGYAWRRRR
jgi:hypothetical protein